MEVARRAEQLIADVGARESGHRPRRGEDRPVGPLAEDDQPARRCASTRHLSTSTPRRRSSESTMPGGVVSDHTHVAGTHPCTAAPTRDDRPRGADRQHAVGDQLLDLAVRGSIVSVRTIAATGLASATSKSSRLALTGGPPAFARERFRRHPRGPRPQRDRHGRGAGESFLGGRRDAEHGGGERPSPAIRPAAKPPISASLHPTALTTACGAGAVRRCGSPRRSRTSCPRARD